MPHYRFDPMKEFETLAQRVKRFAEEFPETFSVEFGKGFDPRVDVYHDNSSITVVAELAGMRKSDISVSLAEGILTLKGSKALPANSEQVQVLRCERSFGDFERSVELPGEVDASSVTAKMEEGLLTITIAKKQREQDKEITIEIN